ncbi:MAG TPA: hypothetical protein VF042_07830 [Gemmatimonadaceae bacterium]
MKKRIIPALLAFAACAEPTSVSQSSNLVIRAGKPAPTPSNITVQALGTLPYSARGSSAIGMALNNGATRADTRVAGYTGYGTIEQFPFTWTLSSGMSPLSVNDNGYGWPTGVADNGLIVGEMAIFGGPNRAFTVTAGGPMIYLPVPGDATYSRASGVSADGTCISGYISAGGKGYAVVWISGALDTLGTGSATGISNDCVTVSGNLAGRAMVWRRVETEWVATVLSSPGKGSTQPNGGVLFSESTDISPNGQYVSGRRLDGKNGYAVVWRYASGVWSYSDMPGSNLYAFGVDNSGRAVGHNTNSQPALWTRTLDGTYTSQILPALGRNSTGWPAAINELGQISGKSQSKDGNVAVMWTVN